MSADWFLLAGDMTAPPAISCNLEAISPAAKGHAVIEINSADDKQEVKKPENIKVHWVISAHSDQENTCLYDAAKAIPRLEGKPSIWAACEFSNMRLLRRYFKQERDVPREELYVSSYWKLGHTEDEHKIAKQRDTQAEGNEYLVAFSTACCSGCFHMCFEIIQDTLPALPLLLARQHVFRLEGFNQDYAAICFFKVNGDSSIILEGIVDFPAWFNCDKSTFEIKALGAIPRFHAIFELVTHLQVYFRLGALPVLRREIPLDNMVGINPCLPNLFNWRCYNSFNGDIQRNSPNQLRTRFPKPGFPARRGANRVVQSAQRSQYG